MVKFDPNEYIDKDYYDYVLLKYIGFEKSSSSRLFKAKCKCGKIKIVRLANLKSGRNQRCLSCAAKKIGKKKQIKAKKKYEGQIINGWEIISYINTGNVLVKCKFCGHLKRSKMHNIKKSSGCQCQNQNSNRELLRKFLIGKDGDTPEVHARVDEISRQRVHQLIKRYNL